MEKLDGAISQGLQAYDYVKKTTTLITDPTRFLYDNLKGTERNLIEELFDPTGRLRAKHFEDANTIYKWAASGSESLLTKLNPGLVGTIQSTSFHRLNSIYARVFADLDDVGAQMESFQVGPAMPPLNAPGPLPSAAPQPSPKTLDCSVLQDESASRELMTNDQQTWLDLVGKCSR